MSLVVAGYENGGLLIVGDTKLTYPNHSIDSLKNHINSSIVELGILKMVIINDKICIAFAGDIEYAECAIKKILPTASFHNITQILLEYHLKSEEKTDFILCTNVVNPSIHVIKNGKIEGASQTWIGDKNAFERFQKSKVGENKSIEAAIDDVINDEAIKTVGGFKISIYILNGKFTFSTYMTMTREAMSFTVSAGKFYNIGHGTAEKGAYTLTFIGTSDDYRHIAFHIKQGNLGIVYSRKDHGLLRPEIKPKMDEVDFHDFIKSQLRILPLISTQSRFHKFFSDAMTAYKGKNFIDAIVLFDKAIKEGGAITEKCEVLFYKAVCFHYTRNPKALEVFKEVVSISPSYQKIVEDFFKSLTIPSSKR